MTTTDRINLQRLLLSCEQKLKDDQVDLWPGSEKIKVATYVKYLQTLHDKTSQQASKNDSVDYIHRINQLKDKVAQHSMHVPVEKGIAEARWTKKKYLDQLKQYHQPDPEWLWAEPAEHEEEEEEEVEEKEEEEETRKLGEQENATEEKAATEKQTQREVPVAAKKETKETTEAPSQIRHRSNNNMNNSSKPRHITREEETTNIEHVLQHHRQMHDEMTTQLSRMAQQLKVNSQSFGDILAKDDKVLRNAQEAVQSNLEKMRKERHRLDAHYAKSWGTSFMTMGIILFVCIMFVLVFFTIKFLPKP
ncbi:hypothetical protein EC973_002168 [Apophysomyces ossiformis]|uniref:Vesicle transport protein USE1 n=1 Tax=Apophysomyces ossiformis TaxID=679940 RepID=A0A8H7BKY1_9FUNG|nr:hypothetical protein EC973_002168 [Apophysomyces ossiformis]